MFPKTEKRVKVEEVKRMSKKTVTRAKRIALKCKDCSGGVAKEVTLCTVFDCPLWAVRFGCSMDSKQYKDRMDRAKKYYHKAFKELAEDGITFEDFMTEHVVGA